MMTTRALLLAAALAAAAALAGAADDRDALASGDYVAAEVQARTALAAEGPAPSARTLTALARALVANGRVADDAADAALRDAFGRTEAQTPARGRAQVARAALALARAQFEKAQEDAQSALDVLPAEAAFAADRADARAILAEAEVGLGLQHYDGAVAAADAGLGDLPDDAQERAWLAGRLLDARALALLYKGDVKGGREGALAALRERAGLGPRHPDSTVSEILLSYAGAMDGQLQDSMRHAEEAASIAEATLRPAHPLRARAEGQLAAREAEDGAYDVSFDRHRAALADAIAALGLLHPQVLDQRNDFANAYALAGDLPAATAMYEEVLEGIERTRGEDALAAATPIYNLSLVHAQAGEWEEAEKDLRRAIGIWRRTHGDGHIHIALGQHELASQLARQGRDAEAVPVFRDALRRYQDVEPDTLLVAGIHSELAAALARLGQAADAAREARRAEPLLTGAGGWRDGSRARLLALRARLAAGRGAAADAARQATESSALLARHIVHDVRFLGERDALSYVDQPFDGRDLLLTLAARKGAAPATRSRALEAVAESRHLVLDQIAARAVLARGATDPRLRGAWARYRDARRTLAGLVYQGAGLEGPDTQARLAALQGQADDAERELAHASAVEAEPPPLDLAALRGALPEGGALVSFVRYQPEALSASAPLTPRYLAFVLRPGTGAPAVVPLGSARVVEGLVTRWRERLAAALADAKDATAARALDAAGHALEAAVWRPLRPHLAGLRRVIVVPDASLLLVNFNALPAGPGRFLVEDGPTLHLVSAERDLLAPAPAPAPQGRILIVANPAYESREALHAPPAVQVADAGGLHLRSAPRRARPCEAPLSSRWPPLPAAEEEARDIAALWGRKGGAVELLSGARATERSLKDESKGADTVHIATHGFVSDPACGADRPRRGLAAPPLQAALPLAGANQRRWAGAGDDDGLLTAEEIASLDLSRARWVVLSACDTGTGAVHERDGILGLRRAFTVAGARTLVMSLWPVDDAYARRWMKALYAARLEQERDTAESVRAATLSLLATLRSGGRPGESQPAFWGAFVAVGDWR